jgi:hypothetical protein
LFEEFEIIRILKHQFPLITFLIMTPLEEFENFYIQKLQPVMGKLKKECSSADNWGYVALFSFIIALISGITALRNSRVSFAGILSITSLGATIVSVYLFTKRNDNFTDDYKQLIVKEIINHVIPGAMYKPDFCISQKEYKASGLFRIWYDDYSGDDFIEGTYKNVSFRCSGLETSYENNATIFKGFFFNGKISSAVMGGTYIWDSNFEQLPATLMDEYRMMPLPRVARVAVSNNTFNNYFSVCSTIPYEALTLLTTERINQMINLKKKLNADIAFSFVSGHCYVAVAVGEDLLEPGEYNPEDKDQIMKSYLTISLIPEIINCLSLYELV